MKRADKWPFVKLSSLAASKKGAIVGGPFGSDLVSRDYVSGGVPVIRGTNLPKHARFSIEDMVFVSESKADKLHLNCAVPGDLVFTQRGTLGQVGLIPENTGYSRFLISQSQMKMTVDLTKADPVYLYYYFRLPSTISNIHNHALQAGVPHINLGILRKFDVVYPPLTAQRKVAGILSSYDELIENNQRRIALLEKMAEELYREWFVRFRFPGHEGTKIVKGVPEGWGPISIAELAPEVRSSVKKRDLLADHRYIGLEHISRKSFSLVDCSSTDGVDSDKLSFQTGDILFSKIRPYLHKVALAHFGGVCSTDAIVLRPRDRIYVGFILLTVFSETFINLASTASKGTKMPRADWGFLKKLNVVVPDEKLLARFQMFFESISSELSLLLTSNEKLKATRDMLLPRLISGKLAVENLDIKLPPSMQHCGSPEADFVVCADQAREAVSA